MVLKVWSCVFEPFGGKLLRVVTLFGYRRKGIFDKGVDTDPSEREEGESPMDGVQNLVGVTKGLLVWPQ